MVLFNLAQWYKELTYVWKRVSLEELILCIYIHLLGVPTFYFNGKQAFSGAQDTETFLKMFDIISEKFPLQKDSKN